MTACQGNLGQWPQCYVKKRKKKKINRGSFCCFALGGGSCAIAATRCGEGRGLGLFTLNLEDLQVTLEKSLSPVPPTGISDSLGFNKPEKECRIVVMGSATDRLLNACSGGTLY